MYSCILPVTESYIHDYESLVTYIDTAPTALWFMCCYCVYHPVECTPRHIDCDLNITRRATCTYCCSVTESREYYYRAYMLVVLSLLLILLSLGHTWVNIPSSRSLERVNNPTLCEFCFTMIGRADIEGSKSSVAMNAWLPQASSIR